MLFPRFSIRRLLSLMVVCAVVFWVTRHAFLGAPWAFGVMAAIVFTLSLFAIFAIFFAMVFGLLHVLPNRKVIVMESPFATDKLPPQIIPPREPT